MPNLLQQLRKDYPDLTFVLSSSSYWSPKEKIVHHEAANTHREADWKLLHETAHGILGHQAYKTDFELLLLEAAAWQKAAELAKNYQIAIDTEHIEDCLDSYRDWLHGRSTCPTCLANGLQTTPRTYECLNCGATWQVSHSRFCRAYRRATAVR